MSLQLLLQLHYSQLYTIYLIFVDALTHLMNGLFILNGEVEVLETQLWTEYCHAHKEWNKMWKQGTVAACNYIFFFWGVVFFYVC